MKKTFLYFVLFLISVNFLNAQVYEGDLVLTTQSEVDAFNYVHIMGNLRIGPSTDITNLNGLSNLTNVDGSLLIQGNRLLPNLTGLTSLSYIGLREDFLILNNASLTSLEGLSSLNLFDGYMIIQDNDALTDLNGLSSLNLPWYLAIVNNDALTSLNGLANFSSIAYLSIRYNPSLTSLEGLSSLTSVSDLIIDGNKVLPNLNGLSNLTTVHRFLQILNNDALTDFDGLSNLNSVGSFASDFLKIQSNQMLKSYCGLYTLFGGDGHTGSLQINDNAFNLTKEQIISCGPCNGLTEPLAKAGSDEKFIIGSTVYLDGSGSSDPGLEIIYYDWSFVPFGVPFGSNSELFNADDISSYFIPDLPGIYRIQLRVNDGCIASSLDIVEITIITIQDAIQEVDDMVQQLPLNEGNKNALSSKLRNALRNYSEGKLIPARSQLNAFLNQLYEFITDGKITQTDAQPLIDYANQIINAINAALAKEDDQIVTLPNDYSLHQNYPNPFNPSTTISWQSPIDGWQTLKVYDLLGREVATLVDEYRTAGSYEVTFDASDLSSGMYLYKLITGDFVSTRKMLLMK